MAIGSEGKINQESIYMKNGYTFGAQLLLSTGIAFLLSISVVAEEAFVIISSEPMADSWRWTDFDHDAGLAARLHDVYEDRNGNLWFSTVRGAQKYDGYAWTTYNSSDGLASGEVHSTMQTREGEMWFGTWGAGISRFDGENWKTYTTSDGLAGNFMMWRGLVQAKDGAIWAGFFAWGDTTGMRGGISRFDGEKWSPVEVSAGPARPNIVKIHAAKDGTLWFTTWGHGILRFDGKKWTRFTTKEGMPGNLGIDILESRDGAMWFGFKDALGLARFKAGEWRIFGAKDGIPADWRAEQLWQVEDGSIWAGNQNGGTLVRFNGTDWQTYSSKEIPRLKESGIGYATTRGDTWFWNWLGKQVSRFNNSAEWTVYTHQDSLFGGVEGNDGSAWFHTRREAVRFKDGSWSSFASSDGFMDARILGVQATSDGAIWFIGIRDGNSTVARYLKGEWKVFTAADGLVDLFYRQTGYVLSKTESSSGDLQILESRDGSVWFMGQYEGGAAVARYDGARWTRYNDLEGELVYRGFEASDGSLWFGTWRPFTETGDGLYRFDGKTWTHYEEEGGLSSNYIIDMAEWPMGTLRVGTQVGLSSMELRAHSDPSPWSNKVDFPVSSPKPRSFVATEHALWFALHPSRDAGVVKFDGNDWTSFRDEDGLIGNSVNRITQAKDGALWFATRSGICRFDGTHWVDYREEGNAYFGEESGILHGWAYPVIRQMEDGSFWLDKSDGHVVHFRYPDDEEAPETTLEKAGKRVSTSGNILLRWTGRDRWNRTPHPALRYQWRLDGGNWSTRSDRTDFTLTGVPSGKHTFEVRATDLYGNVEPTPALHKFVVESPWWMNPWMLGLTGLLLGLVGIQTGRVIQRDRKLRIAQAQLIAEMERELQTAHEMQMGLMPLLSPEIPGLDISGRCIPAKRVCGDFFQYFQRDNKLSICLTDVTGHAMDAAIPAVMFNGILDREMDLGEDIQSTFVNLNRSLHRTLASRTFICFTLGELDTETRIFKVSNAGCPFAYHYRNKTGDLVELQADAYPLGVSPDTEYELVEAKLEAGDRIVFCTDGIPESENNEGVQFGYARTEEMVLKSCQDGLTADETIDFMLGEVETFRSGCPQSDDMTCVVIRVLDS